MSSLEETLAERNVLHGVIKAVRAALFKRGHCGDGHLPSLINRALDEARAAGRVDESDIFEAIMAADRAFPDDMEGTVAERVTLLVAERDAARRDAVVVREGHWDEVIAERDAAIRERDELIDAVMHGPLKGKTLHEALKEALSRAERAERIIAGFTEARPFSRPWPCPRCKAPADKDCTHVSGAAMAGDYGPEIHVERCEPPEVKP